MAVVDVYANPIVESQKSNSLGVGIPSNRTISVFGGRGEEVMEMVQLVTITDGDSAGSVYRLFNSVPGKYYLDDVEILNPAIAGATDVDLGVYLPNFGVVVNANVIGDALDLSSAHNYPTPLHAANNVALADRIKALWNLAGGSFDKEPNAFDFALTLNTNATATGTLYVKARFIEPLG